MVYLATPYTHRSAHVMRQRIEESSDFEAYLLRNGLVVYNPIRTSESISHLLPHDFDWYRYDLKVLGTCDVMVILKLNGWDSSKGVAMELEYANRHGIPCVMANAPEGVCDDIEGVVNELRKLIETN